MCDEALIFPANYKINYKSKTLLELKREYFHFLAQPDMKDEIPLLGPTVTLSFRAKF